MTGLLTTFSPMTEASASKDPADKPANKDLDQILRPAQVEEETNASWKTIARARRDKVVQLGKRAVGMRRGDVLAPPTCK
jgi:hypothetical protein